MEQASTTSRYYLTRIFEHYPSGITMYAVRQHYPSGGVMNRVFTEAEFKEIVGDNFIRLCD